MKLSILQNGLLVLLLAVPLTYAQTPATPRVTILGGAGSFLGVGIQEINSERAKSLKLKEEAGVEITRVDENSPAEKAGLKTGDVVTEYNGQRIEGIEQFSRLVRETPAGREVKLGIVRNGSPQTVAAKVGTRGAISLPKIKTELESLRMNLPDIPRSLMSWRSPVLGVQTETLEGQLAEYFGVKEGVLVRAVTKDSAAEKAGLKAGDVIIKIDDEKIATPSQLTSRLQSLRGKFINVVVMRDRKEVAIPVMLSSADRAVRIAVAT